MTHRPQLLVAVMLSLSAACMGQVVGDDPGQTGGGGNGSPTGNGPPGGGNGPSGSGGGNGGPMVPPSASAPTTTGAIPDNCTGDEVPAPRRLRLLTRVEYANTVADLLGIPVPTVDNLPVESVVDGFDNNAVAQVVDGRHMDEYLATGERLATAALMTSKAKLMTCQPTTPGCDRTVVTALGRRAFRRPLTEAEITRYLPLFSAPVTGGNFDKGLELTIRALLASPNFLYRSEVGEKAPDGSFKLTGYEVATALSYFLWSTTPDEALLQAAATGQLDKPEGVDLQAKRLLADPRSRPAVANFFREWLGTTGFQFTNKDAAVYPTFNDRVRNAMIAEADAFANYVTFEGGGTFKDLFSADYVFANDVLSTFYGLPPLTGPELRKVPAGPARGGLLTLGAVVGMHAHSNESSPVRRGVFVRQRLLCQTLPPPPANLNIVPPGLDATLTTRARFKKHSSDPQCAACHQFIDPLGFGFERYDGVGAYRDKEAGMAIDASGDVRGMEALTADTSAPFDGPLQLAGLVAASPNAQACLPRQLFRYARGGETASDACAVKKLQGLFSGGSQNIRQLLIEAVKQKSFLSRSGS
jgi:hypothetical protein